MTRRLLLAIAFFAALAGAGNALTIPITVAPSPTPTPVAYTAHAIPCVDIYTSDTTGYCSTIPPQPSPNPSSSADLAAIVDDTTGGYPAMANAFAYDPASQPGGSGFGLDSALSAYINPNGKLSSSTTGLIAYAVNCNGAFTCTAASGNIQNGPIYLPVGARNQNNSDHHLDLRTGPCLNGVSDPIGCEQMLWVASQPNDQTGQTLTAQGGGQCPLSGAGYSCSGITAGNAPVSKTAIDPADALTAMNQSDGNGILTHALNCDVSATSAHYVFPSAYYDTGNGGPPNGARLYVPLLLATINSTWAGHPYYAMILRTLAVRGCFIDDTTGGYAGISIGGIGPSPYTVNGGPDPWAAIAAAEGIAYPGGSAPSFPMEGYTVQTLFRECLYRGQVDHNYGSGPYPATC